MKKFGLGKYKAYIWKGLNKWDDKVAGIIIAEDDMHAENEARKLGVTVRVLSYRHFYFLPGAATKNIKIMDIVLLMRQLSTMISAGVPLVQALDIASNGSEKVRVRALLLTIRDDVLSGKTFAEAIAPYPYFFNPLICGLINAGEQSGTLDRMVSEVANYLEHQEYLRNRIKRAMYYPITMLTIATIVIVAMVVFLIPRFEKIYQSFNAKLPAFTQSILNFSHLLREDWWLILIIAAIFVFIIRQLNQKSLYFQYLRDRIAIGIFLFGNLTRKAIVSRICSTMAITLAAGIPLIDALNRVAKVANNLLFRDAMIHAREQVSQGESIALALRSTQLFPPMVTQMIEIGEKSGALDQMFAKVGEYYRDQVNTAVEGLTTMLEPLLIVVIGLIVGVFVFAMYLPIFNLGLAIK